MSGRDPEFYVGYLDRAPAETGRFVRRSVVLLALGLVLLAAGAATFQRSSAPGVFEFNVLRPFEGVLVAEPLPLLRFEQATGGGNARGSLLLVGLGKRGLPGLAREGDGRRVRFRGTLIHRGALVMVEMSDPSSFEVLGPPAPGFEQPALLDLGPVELIGELVDTKCFLGVMRPATGKVHRACAVRCLDGGVPPGLLVRGSERATTFLLAGADGGPLRFDAAWAARAVTVRGNLELDGDLPRILVSAMELAD